MEHVLKIAKDFSPFPGARYRVDGRYSGEEFFEDKLDKAFGSAIEAGAMLIIDLDGTEGYATSFLDEAFKLLSKKYTSATVLANLKIISTEEPDLIDEIIDYIKESDEIRN